jgi:hypothetical protein
MVFFCSLFMNYALGTWMDDMERGSSETDGAMAWYLVTVFSVFASTVLKLALGLSVCLLAAQKMHDQLIHSVMLAPCSWFDATPIGRIINRFSQDICAVVSRFALLCDLRYLNLFFARTRQPPSV